MQFTFEIAELNNGNLPFPSNGAAEILGLKLR